MSETIYDVIRDEHDKQRRLIDLLEETHGASADRRELFDCLRVEVLSHSAIEERLFYAALLSDEVTRDRIGHSVEEHKEAEAILHELGDKDMSSPAWLNRFHTLAKDLRHHMDEEELEVFQLAGKVLTRAREEQLAREYRTAKPSMGKARKAA